MKMGIKNFSFSEKITIVLKVILVIRSIFLTFFLSGAVLFVKTAPWLIAFFFLISPLGMGLALKLGVFASIALFVLLTWILSLFRDFVVAKFEIGEKIDFLYGKLEKSTWDLE